MGDISSDGGPFYPEEDIVSPYPIPRPMPPEPDTDAVIDGRTPRIRAQRFDGPSFLMGVLMTSVFFFILSLIVA